MEADAHANVPVNLCRCGGKDAAICTCGHEREAPKALAGSMKATNAMDGLAALAQAAMFCCGNDLPPTSDAPQDPPTPTAAPTESASRKHIRSCCSTSPSSRPPSPKAKRSKHSVSHDHVAGPALTSIPLPHTIHSASALPVFPPVAPLGTSISFDEAGCCCGRQCACPGCVVHRGVDHAAKDVADCTDGECRTCVDHDGGITLPEHVVAYSQGRGYTTSSAAPLPSSLSASASSSSMHTSSVSGSSARTSRDRRQSVSCIDAFFATAASLPAPPPGRPKVLDPTNVLLYPLGVLSGDPETRSLFGLVELPKLQCNCPGGCGCPEGQCGCGDGCTGCGSSHAENEEQELESASAPVPAPERSAPKVGSCCSG